MSANIPFDIQAEIMKKLPIKSLIQFRLAPIRCFSFSGLGYIAFKKYEFVRRNHAWNKRCDALKLHADVVGQQNDAMKRWSELLDRIANVLKQAKALEHQDNALRRANALRLRADALGRRADEYLRSAKTFGLRAKALVERARAFSLQIKHSPFGKKNLFKALIAVEYAAADIIERPDNFKMDVLESIKINGLGEKQDFVLEIPLGSLCGINAITRYVASGSSLVKRTKFEFAQIEQWVGFSTVELDLNLRGWALLRLGYFNYDEHFEAHYIKKLKNALDGLNTHLASHEFLVGNSVTLADIITTCNLLYGFEWLMTKVFTSEFPHVEKYLWDMIDQPNFKKVTGEVKQADVVIPLSEVMKREQPKVEKPNRRRFRNLTKYPKEEAKPENPLDLPSNMVLDDWKKLYSQTKTKSRLSEAAIEGSFT
ncbi:glutathione S-transferase [Tanacetum coccineum]